jgi:hydrogenase-4 membrane subunit HyfE
MTVSGTPVLRPLGVGEVLDTALAVYRRHAIPLWKIVSVVVALPSAMGGALAVAVRQVSESDSQSGALLLLELLFLAVALIASSLATAATYRLVADAYLGRVVDPDASLKFGLQRWTSVLWVTVLSGLGVIAASILLLIPGLYLYVAWAVAIPVLLAENARGRKALRRSRALVRGRFWGCAGVIVLSTLLALIVTIVIRYGIALIVDSSGNDTILFLEQGVSTLIANTLVLPFQVAVTTVLYIDLRVRKEGFDIQLMTHTLEPGGAGET